MAFWLINVTFAVFSSDSMNTLYYGDNLKILLEYIKNDSVACT